jgi:hypothetical protein
VEPADTDNVKAPPKQEVIVPVEVIVGILGNGLIVTEIPLDVTGQVFW